MRITTLCNKTLPNSCRCRSSTSSLRFRFTALISCFLAALVLCFCLIAPLCFSVTVLVSHLCYPLSSTKKPAPPVLASCIVTSTQIQTTSSHCVYLSPLSNPSFQNLLKVTNFPSILSTISPNPSLTCARTTTPPFRLSVPLGVNAIGLLGPHSSVLMPPVFLLCVSSAPTCLRQPRSLTHLARSSAIFANVASEGGPRYLSLAL